MFKNYFKIAFRSLLKNRGYSFLNIFGLAIGIACASLIFLWVEDEVNFDATNTKKDRIYIARENLPLDTYVFTHSSTPVLFGPAIMQDFPGITNFCRASESKTFMFSAGERSVFAKGKYADPAIFDIFTLPFVQGNAATAFTQRHTLVITQKTAKKFFGNDANLIGKTIRVDNKQDFVISGVIKDIPTNSTVQFEWLMPFQIFIDNNPQENSWGNNSIQTYVELKRGVNPDNLNKQLYGYLDKKLKGDPAHVFLFAMNDWHLYSEFKDGKKTGSGQIQYVHLFTIIAWIILFIACINFMNLATASSEKRAREVGVRKVLGAAKKTLIAQFVGETLFMALISAIIAILLILLVLPAFNTLVQKQLSPGFDNPYHVLTLLLITTICGLVAGSYPSLYLSSFNPVAVLKGIKLKGSNAALIRKGLVVMQFTVSIILIISTIIVYQQIQHVKNRQLGFNKDNLLEMDMHGDMGKNFEVIKQDLLITGYIENVALAGHSTLGSGDNTSNLTWAGKNPNAKVLISIRSVTPEFIATSGMKVIEGRNLTVNDTSGPMHMLVTQSLAKAMGKGSPIGKTLHFGGDSNMVTVVGVVNDYVYGNMYSKPDPVLFAPIKPKYTSLMYVRIKPQSNTEKVLASIQGVLKKDNPAYPFDYRFVDEEFNKLFLSEMLVSKLSKVFAGLAVMISCLGLFGLAAYTAERRIKEIGIRKVLGASVSGLVGLLSKDFLQLVLLSCVLAFPIAYWAMQNWLTHYEYRITIQLWVFVAAGMAGVVIALFTISFQSIKAALTNPVKSLRSE